MNFVKIIINIHFFCERKLDFELNIIYLDSDASDAFVVQAADYVANSFYNKYEFGTDIYCETIKDKINVIEEFPKENFGN